MNTQYAQRVAAVGDKPAWSLILVSSIVGMGVVAAMLTAIGTGVGMLIFGGSFDDLFTPQSILGMATAVLLGGWLMTKISKITWTDLGFVRGRIAKDALLGVAAGVLTLALVAVLVWMVRGVNLHWVMSTEAIVPILIGLVFFAFQGVMEELVFRGYMMPHFSKAWANKAWGDKASIIVTSLLFAALHGANPGMTFMPLLNLVIFGLVFALLYYRTGNMWITGLAHSAWNFAQGFLFGSLVSGNRTEHSVVLSEPIAGRVFTSGGDFGYEGSIVTTVVGVVIILLLAKPRANRR